jgi:uncharacterized protein
MRFRDNFLPSRGAPGGHWQTVAAIYLPWDYEPYRAVQHRVRLHDGDQLVLHDDCPAGWQPGDRVALILHGLGGSHDSTYSKRILPKLTSRGVRVFRLDARGCGAGEGCAELLVHCGRWADVAAAVEQIDELTIGSPLAVVGFSLGGALALNLVAELGESRCGGLASVLAVSPPVELSGVAQRMLHTRVGRAYSRHFTKNLMRLVNRRRSHSSALSSLPLTPAPKWLHEFDDLITVPLGGFRDTPEYYRQASVGPRLHQVRVPTQIITAADDPIIPTDPLQRHRLSSSVNVLVTRYGGHVGYVGRKGADPDRRWIDWRIVEWVLGMRTYDGLSALRRSGERAAYFGRTTG